MIGIVGNNKEKRIAFARRLIKDHMHKGQIVLPLLELPYGTCSCDSMRIENRALTMAAFKLYKHMTVIWTAALTSMIDKRFRSLTDEIWLVEKRTLFRFDARSGKASEIVIKPNDATFEHVKLEG
jgi:hypothetical protein